MLRRPRRALFALGLFTLVACGGGEPTTGLQGRDDVEPAVTTVSVSPGEATADAFDATVAFEATAEDQQGSAMSGVDFTWTSSDPGTAEVDGEGVATVRGNGTTRIVARADGVADTAILEVEQTVDSVAVSPTSLSLAGPGDTARLAADALDANDHPVKQVIFAWSSSDPDVATVDEEGLVTAHAEGSVDVEVSAGSVVDSAAVGVGTQPRTDPSISSVSPTPLPEGGTAVVSGENFDPDLGDNTVTVDGAAAVVTSATATRLEVTVPTFDCLPAREVTVELQTPGGNAEATADLSPDEQPVSLEVGEQVLEQFPSDFCLQFDETAASERYLVGVQSISRSVSSLTPVSLTSEAADDGGAATVAPVALAAAGVTGGGGVAPERPRRLEAQRAAEARIRSWERRNLDPAASLAARGSSRTVSPDALTGGPVQVGDTVSLRVPDVRFGDICENFVDVGAVVKAIGTEGIFVADTANPSGGFTGADYRALSDRLDAEVLSTLIDYFGQPSDLDGNSRVVVLVSQAVNVTFPGALAFVWGGDLFPRTSCSASDEGEQFYARAPDPNGEVGSSYPTELARSYMPFILAHEVTHIIQQSRRRQAGLSWMSSSLSEGQATFGEEVVGHAVTGRTTGQDYGAAVAFNGDGSDEIDWYANGFTDLARYFGFVDPTARVAEAPDQCGWWRGDPSPCQSRSLWYGVSWSFLRWISDRFGPDHPGGERGLHRDLVDSPTLDPRGVADVLGEPFPHLMAGWAAALYVDGRIAAADPRLTFTSWDLFDVEENTYATAHLQPLEMGFADWRATGEVRASSAGYVTVGGAGRPAAAIRARNTTGGLLPLEMQLWVVRLE